MGVDLAASMQEEALTACMLDLAGCRAVDSVGFGRAAFARPGFASPGGFGRFAAARPFAGPGIDLRSTIGRLSENR